MLQHCEKTYVFRFEVTVDDVKGMEVLEGEQDLCGVERDSFVSELTTTYNRIYLTTMFNVQNIL